ncbi:MAG TPA: hypothetical protein VD833_23940 [Vicinamibacterales bacterium]|nr:hypothetical protein [Vicinamibacterales bacterium]
MPSAATRLRLIVFLLRLSGAITVSAFLAMLLPVDWMASTHEWLGLGAFPRAPVVEYLARSIAALYGFHGALLLLISTDPVRFRPLVWFVVVVNISFGLMMLAIDLHAGMPAYWTAAEGPPITALGLVLGLLNRQPPTAGNEP